MLKLSRFYPLHGLPRQGQIWSWISFDVANQSFTLIINTLLFSIFFQQVVLAGRDDRNTIWSIVFAASMLLVVLASPIAGAIADAKRWKKEALLLTGLACAVLTCAMGLIPPGGLVLAVLLYIPANFMFNIGENFLASFLPQLARQQDFGRVSGFSWAVAYSSALIMLVLVAATMLMLGLKDPSQWRPFFVAAGVWFLAFAVPTLLVLREDEPTPGEKGNVLVLGFRRLAQSARSTRKYRDLAMLFLASLFYGAGMAVVISFASILAMDFGFTDVELVIFTAVITVSGVVGTLVPTFLQDRLGHKRTTLALLLVWVVTTLLLAAIAYRHAQLPPGTTGATWPLWVAGNMLGFGLGSLGSANRAFVGYLTPPSRSAEFFGVWGLVFKLAAVLVVPFGVAKDVLGTTAALIVLAVFIVVGFVLTLFIDEKRGHAAACAGEAAGGVSGGARA